MDTYRADMAHIGKSVVVKGELSGSEDLYVDGEVEGSIDLREHTLIIGPNSKVRANIVAKAVTVHGKVDGNVTATNKVDLKNSAVLNGDINTQRIVIEDGAFLKGSIEVQKAEPAKAQGASVPSAAAASAPVPAEQNK
jgi:cytoskeletal protein CcmA (bactofilin family)